MRKFVVITITIFIVLLTAAGVYLFIDSNNFKIQIAEKDKELNTRISQERDILRKSFEDKYRAEMVSYEAMYKKAEAQMQKMREMKKR